MDTLIVGAGFAGATCARRLADAGHPVRVIDKRPHIAGNAYDRPNEHGLLVHEYGPHIFHTNSDKVVDFLSRFTAWRPYEHRVLAVPDAASGEAYPMPINRRTINALYGLDLDEAGVAAFLERVREPREPLRSSEDVVLNSVGRDLCERFFRGYTRKQWGLDLAELSAGVAARIPTRCNDDDRYFTDRFQAMPQDGYTRMFARLLDHPRIQVETGVAYDPARHAAERLIFTGPIDEYYGHRHGRLPYRSLRFEHEHRTDCDRFQPVGTVNYPNDHAYTRITEFKHLTGQVHGGTALVREYPCDDGEPYYPIPRPANEALFKRYQALAEAETQVHFIGRLAQYRYYNMDQVVAAALALCERLLQPSAAALEAA
ncbi:UDP-galactopyranose mutase [Piscinibacter sakaiensis]|uniref:UDP-galactopyranose mutase n=1 Tax=Piscinibacter sakaiensis TaxID=1547922 RepID=A0A0K8P5N9_PISS1|nr:UDP-galactopyranose mutase [Piscinibacter sakaiensis]GAP37530.1 UDP-galactopyranose mutase [Piscinibacter sakaiensis]